MLHPGRGDVLSKLIEATYLRVKGERWAREVGHTRSSHERQ